MLRRSEADKIKTHRKARVASVGDAWKRHGQIYECVAMDYIKKNDKKITVSVWRTKCPEPNCGKVFDHNYRWDWPCNSAYPIRRCPAHRKLGVNMTRAKFTKPVPPAMSDGAYAVLAGGGWHSEDQICEAMRVIGVFGRRKLPARMDACRRALYHLFTFGKATSAPSLDGRGVLWRASR